MDFVPHKKQKILNGDDDHGSNDLLRDDTGDEWIERCAASVRSVSTLWYNILVY